MKALLKLFSTANLMTGVMALAISFSGAFALAQADNSAPQDHGGGGVLQNGKYMSFYTAGLYTEPTPVVMTQVPSLDGLINFLNKFEYLSDETKLKWINLILPSGSHQYYRAQDDKLSPVIQDRLLEEYARLTKQAKASIRLFAITDTNSRITFLLPDFYKLNSLDQMGILMHEALWLVYPRSDYSFIVNSEMTIEAAIDQPTNTNRVSEALKYLGNSVDQLILAVRADEKSGALKNMTSRGGSISLKKIFGASWVKCMDNGSDGDCFRYANQVVYQNIVSHPNSLLLRAIYSSMTTPSSAVTVSADRGDDDDYSLTSWSTCDIRMKVYQSRSGRYGKLGGTCSGRKKTYGTTATGQSVYLYKEIPLTVELQDAGRAQ
jgi:hypothetical protein